MIFGGSNSASRAAEKQIEFQEKALAELRKQFGKTEANFAPFLAAGTNAIPTVVDASSTAGLSERLGEIFNTDIFKNLVGERTRSVEGQLASAGLSRSGDALAEIANIPTDIGLALENLLFGRQSGLVKDGQNAAGQLGAFGADNAANVAGILQNQGSAAASGILGDAQAQSAGIQGLLNLGGLIGGASIEAGGIGSLVSSFFSDPRLKENLQIKSLIRLKDGHTLGLYSWDWVETDSKLIKSAAPYGFLTTEVKKHFPQHVFEFAGFEAIDYEYLLKDIEEHTKVLH